MKIVVVRSQAVLVPPPIIVDALPRVILDDDYIPRRVQSINVAAMDRVGVEKEAATFRSCHLNQMLLTICIMDPIVLEAGWSVVLHAKPRVVVRATCDQRWVVVVPDRIRVNEELEPPTAAPARVDKQAQS